MPVWKPIGFRRPRTLPLILLPMLLCGAAALWLGQDISWDLQNYHLYNPYAFLEDRHGLDLMPAGAQNFFNPWLDTLYFLAATQVDPRAAAFLIGALQGINFALLYFIARHILRASPALHLLAALLGLLSVGFLSEIGTTLQDAVVALFPLGALLLLLQGLNQAAGRRTLLFLLAGLLAGIGCGLKPVVAANALALCLALLLLRLPFAARLRLAFIFGTAVLAGILLVDGWWLQRVWDMQGNPTFPQFNNLFEGPFATPDSHKDARFLPVSPWEKLLWPFLFTLDPYRVAEYRFEQISWPLAYCLLLVLGAQRALLRVRGAPPHRPLASPQRLVLGYCVIAYLLWLQLFGIYRYLLPIELLLPQVFLLAAASLFRSGPLKGAAFAVLLLATLYNLGGVPSWGRAPWRGELYRVERPDDLREVRSVVLMGQPLAWLVPALDLRVPFVQGLPNFNATEAYWRRALRLVEGGGMRVIFDPAVISAEKTARRLATYGFHPQHCVPLRAWLGGSAFTYQYCTVKKGP